MLDDRGDVDRLDGLVSGSLGGGHWKVPFVLDTSMVPSHARTAIPKKSGKVTL